MTMTVNIPPSLSKILDAVTAGMRRNLFSIAGENIHRLVQRHLAKEAPQRHFTAERLGGVRTGHLEKGISGSSFAADDRHAEVIIPVAGISRAFGPVTITPRHAKALTLPVHGSAYGHRVAELQRMGWSIFKPKGASVLMGQHKGDSDVVSLYALKKRVTLRQDRSLLPSDKDMASTVARAMMGEIQRVMRKAS